MKRANIKYILTCLILLISLFLWTGCLQLNIDTSPLPDIADVVAKVKPSVVAINTELVTYDIFNQPYTQEVAGSGWIIDEDGLIVTNNHVVEGATTITVTLADGTTLPVDMSRVFTDSLTDLAVLEINATNLSPADIGDSSDEVRVGDWVVAIGNPLGLGISAKEGIVSRLEVSITVSSGQTLYDLIETSAAINPGNSGGPLVNMNGEVIGITSAKIAMVGVEGMGYALSTDMAIPIINELINTGHVVRPWLGIVLHPTYDKGALITKVVPDSPADEAGLEAGDVIIIFNGQEISTAQGLIQAIHSCQIGQRVEITFLRDEAENITHATLTESPPP
jgi:serine protease Do